MPLFQSESKCETIVMKMTLICMKVKLHAELIFIWKVSHLDSFWNRGTIELGNSLLNLKNSSDIKYYFPRIPNIGQNISKRCILWAFICFIQEIWWLTQESGRFGPPTSFPGSLILPPGASEERPWLGLVTCPPESGRWQLNCRREERPSRNFVYT